MKNIFQSTECLSREEIQHYSKGEISDDLRYKVENHLIDCPLCLEAIDGYVMMGGKGNELDDVFDELYQKIDSKASAKPESAITQLIPWNRVAAGLLFLITATAAYLYYQSDQSKGNYQAYFNHEDNGFAMRSIEDNSVSQDMVEGIQLYQNKNFQASLSFFEDYIKMNPESTVATYYAGMSALKAGAKEIAFDLLLTVRMNDKKLYEEATWVLAGIYLDKGEADNARNLLKDLIKIENGFYTERAQELLEKI